MLLCLVANISSIPRRLQYSVYAHQTVGATEYHNVANDLDDLQGSAGSQFTHSASVDDDSLMKDSRGMRHRGLSAFISVPWCAPVLPTAVTKATTPTWSLTRLVSCRSRRMNPGEIPPDRSPPTARIISIRWNSWSSSVTAHRMHAMGTCVRWTWSWSARGVDQRPASPWVGGSSAAVTVTRDFQRPFTPVSVATVLYTYTCVGSDCAIIPWIESHVYAKTHIGMRHFVTKSVGQAPVILACRHFIYPNLFVPGVSYSSCL